MAGAKCTPFIDELKQIGDVGLMPMVLEDADRTRAVAYINAQEPVTDFTFEIIVVVPKADGGGYLLSGNDGQICWRELMPAQPFRAFIKAALGAMA
jgi:hypothetical protein